MHPVLTTIAWKPILSLGLVRLGSYKFAGLWACRRLDRAFMPEFKSDVASVNKLIPIDFTDVKHIITVHNQISFIVPLLTWSVSVWLAQIFPTRQSSVRRSKRHMIAVRFQGSVVCTKWGSSEKVHNEHIISFTKNNCHRRKSRYSNEIMNQTKSCCTYKIHRCVAIDQLGIQCTTSLTLVRGRHIMAVIFQTTFSNTFYWMKMCKFLWGFYWTLLPEVQLTIFHHCVIMAWRRPGDNPFLNQYRLVFWRIYA